ncbi:trypsin-like peptidase domain-containing protein [Sulfitobacter albidus]|uniref:Trypsin-like peptidase domain-containing protein n=1 Tax=Sulfitobacter albidus TaxID=2829501 RepID=A0A975JDE9_9RHOB|nr:trypsin-like peptidase domain-containing protein [Sulfitobacter albidus]QUJ76403.1 trypsin-like peptidase domain-containing protein [Sulfitobacter albidus]
MSNLKAILAVLLLCAAPVWAQEALVGLDRDERLRPWRAVGKVEIANQGYCTGTLIAPDTVLTAAHCTYDAAGAPFAAGIVTFRAGLRGSAAEAERRVTQIVRAEGFEHTGPKTLNRIAADVALLRLERPIASHVIAPFAIEPRALNGGEVSVVSYGQGRDALPSLQLTCGVLGQMRDVVVMDCDTTFGSSGAPVFRRDGERFRIASIVSGSARFDGVRRTTGMALPATVRRLQARMIAEKPRVVPTIRRIGVGERPSGGAKFISN